MTLAKTLSLCFIILIKVDIYTRDFQKGSSHPHCLSVLIGAVFINSRWLCDTVCFCSVTKQTFPLRGTSPVPAAFLCPLLWRGHFTPQRKGFVLAQVSSNPPQHSLLVLADTSWIFPFPRVSEDTSGICFQSVLSEFHLGATSTNPFVCWTGIHGISSVCWVLVSEPFP